MALLFLEAIRDDERTSVLTTFNFAWSLATVVGSLIGAGVLLWGDKSPVAYLTIFGLSCVALVAALALLKRVPEFNRTLEQLPSPQLSKPPWQSSKRWYLPSKCPQLPARASRRKSRAV